jgi:multiple sugar transport system substrate-binding protein
MKKTLSTILCFIIILAFSFTAMGISVVAVKAIKLNETSVTISAGQSFALKASLSPANASNKIVRYSSADIGIATVDKSGNITGINAGDTIITAISSNTKVSAKCKVKVLPVTLRIGWWGSQTRHDGTLKVLDMYTAKTGVAFEPEFFSRDDYVTKLNTLVAANDCFDIMQMGGDFPTYQNHLEYLNDYIKNGIIDTSNINKNYVGITTLDGNTVGLSLGTNAQAIAYDPAPFYKCDVPLPTNKWTWADFENAAKTIHTKLGIFGSSKLDEFTVLSIWVNQYMTKEGFFLDPYRVKLNYTDNKKVAEFFAMKKRLTDAGAYPNPAQLNEIKNIEGDPLVTGKAAMTWVASNQFVALSKAAKRPLALVMPPRRSQYGSVFNSIMSSQMFTIYKGSEYKEAAARFISYFVNDIDANKVLLGERGVPISTAVRSSLSDNLTPENRAIYDYLNLVSKEGKMEIVLNSPVQPQINDIFRALGEQVVAGKVTPDEAALNLRTESEKILATVK